MLPPDQPTKVERGSLRHGATGLRLAAAFAALDKNGKGVVDKCKLSDALLKFVPETVTESALHRLFKAVDMDCTGLVRYEELAAWMCREKASGPTTAPAAGTAKSVEPRPQGRVDKKFAKSHSEVVLPPVSPSTMAKPKEPHKEKQKHSLIKDRYLVGMTDDDFMGEGTYSICRRATDTQTGRAVAVKVYKCKVDETALVKFRRQIEVLEELARPFEKPSDPRLWCETLEHVSPGEVFLKLLDYSKGKDGKPGLDPKDGMLYTVTELAQCSLKDYIRSRRGDNRPLSKEKVHKLTKNVMVVIAGLHAKGLVHLDIKPENLMFFNGVLKLIDVDGCMKINSTISIDDESLSFSPVYCSPQWANFIVEDQQDPVILAHPALDVWSAGMTIMELVTLESLLKPHYASFFKEGRSKDEASFMFFDWLGSMKKSPVTRKVKEFDVKLYRLLADNLLECSSSRRSSMAETLSHPYLTGADIQRTCAEPDRCADASASILQQVEALDAAVNETVQIA
jgi:serine/threonine protein kinase